MGIRRWFRERKKRKLSQQAKRGDIKKFLELGKAHLEDNELDKSVEAFRTVVNLESDNAEAHYQLSQAYRRMERLSEAISELKTAVELEPASMEYRNALGVVYCHKGEPKNALGTYKDTWETATVIDEVFVNRTLDEWSKRETFVKNNLSRLITISEIKNEAHYVLVLKTLYEERRIEQAHEPYKGQPVFTEPLLNIWEEPAETNGVVQPPSGFKQETRNIRLKAEEEVKTCYECHGAGEVTCPTCNRTGREVCPECHGSCRVRCSACWGSGSVSETETETYQEYNPSTGRTETKTRTKIVQRQCSNCGGSGRITCPRCHGFGWITCRTCSGRGVITCPVCEGYKALLWYHVLVVDFKPCKDSTIPLSNDISLKEDDREKFLKLLYEEKKGEEFFAGPPVLQYQNEPRIEASNISEIDGTVDELIRQRIANFSRPSFSSDVWRTVRQRLEIAYVPIITVLYSYRKKQDKLYLYGMPTEVYMPGIKPGFKWLIILVILGILAVGLGIFLIYYFWLIRFFR